MLYAFHRLLLIIIRYTTYNLLLIIIICTTYNVLKYTSQLNNSNIKQTTRQLWNCPKCVICRYEIASIYSCPHEISYWYFLD